MSWRTNLRNPKNLGVIRGPHGHASQPHLSVHAKGGRIGKFGGGRTNLLEELGRVEAEPSNRNRRAEISRVHGELNRGYAKGGRAGHAHGMSAGKQAIKRITERLGGGEEGKPHSTRAGRRAAGVRRIKRSLSARQRDKWGDLPPWKRDPKTLPKQPWESKAKGGRIGLKHGSKPWGTGPKPGTHEFLLQNLHKRKGKAKGGKA